LPGCTPEPVVLHVRDAAAEALKKMDPEPNSRIEAPLNPLRNRHQ
jgi:hypothetical protein